MGLRSIVVAGVLAVGLAGASGSAQTALTLTPNTWHVVPVTYTGAPDGGKLIPMTWQVIGAYDPVSQRTITFDRWSDPIRGNTIYANGILAFDPVSRVVEVLKLSNWKRLAVDTGYKTVPLPANATDPTPVDRHPLAGGVALDPVGNAIYLVNGANQTARDNFPAGHPQDTWKLDLTTRRWSKVADGAEGDPHPRIDVGNYSCMVYDPPSQTFVYFQTDPRGTIPWLLNPRTGSWTQRPIADSTIFTSVGGCAYDTKRNRIVVLGGGHDMYNPKEDSPARQTLRAYSLADNKWTTLAPPPFVPYGSEFAYSTRDDVFLALGGRNAPKRTALYHAASNTWQMLSELFERGTNVQRQTVTYNVAHDVFVYAGGSWDKPVWALFRYGGGETTPPSPTPEPAPAPGPSPTPEPSPPTSIPSTGVGRGCTSVYFIDMDCDGHGVGVRRSGVYSGAGLGDNPDADDSDPKINSAQSVLAAFDANANGRLDAAELKSFLRDRRQLTVNRIFYIATNGDNTTGAADNPARPFRTYYHAAAGTSAVGLRQHLEPGDVVVFREGTYVDPRLGSCCPYLASGNPEAPITLMAAPGERVWLHTTAPVATTNSHDLILDGFGIDNPTSPGFGNGLVLSTSRNVTVRNVEIQRFNFPSGMQDMHHVTIERFISHDQKEHGLYLGSRELPNTDITIRDSIVYRNGVAARYGGVQHNGRVTNLRIENNILHSNGQWGVSLVQGVSRSLVQNNLIFNNQGHGIIFQVYPGHGEEACASGTGTICPYEQTDNLITNNTIWVGRFDLAGAIPSTPRDAAAILVGRNDGLGTPGDGKYSQGRNTVQNNIIVTDRGPMIRILSAEWLDTWTVRNNVVFRHSGDAPIVSYGSTSYGFSQFESTFPLVEGNQFADPKFTAVDQSFFNTPERFNFMPLAESPAIGFAIATNAPSTDLRGVPRVAPPDAGAYAFRNDGTSFPSPPGNLRIIR